MDIEQGVHAYVCRVEYVRVQYASVSISTMLHKKLFKSKQKINITLRNLRVTLCLKDSLKWEYYFNEGETNINNPTILCIPISQQY